jgi:hypothetical protein
MALSFGHVRQGPGTLPGDPERHARGAHRPPAHFIAGTWNLAVGIFFFSHGHQWRSVLVAVSALIFLAAYFLGRGKSGSRSDSLS